MSVKVNRRGRRPRNGRPSVTNADIVAQEWGAEPPRWIVLLASACDATSQGEVALKLRKSGSYVSRLINNSYPGDMAEAERLVRAAYGNEDVLCPIWGPIPLESCMRNRRRSGPPRNQAQRLFASHCPTCPNNSDLAVAGEDDQ